MYNEINAHSVELYIGEVRSGKTLCMTADTHEDIKKLGKKIKIFANYTLHKDFIKGTKLTMDNIEIIKKEDLIQFHKYKVKFTNCIFLIDELQQWLDNRDFMKQANKSISYFFGQMGKRGNVLRGTVHDYYLIDLRGRLYTQKQTYVFKGLVYEGKWNQILNVNRPLSKDENKHLYIQKVEYVKKLIKTNFLPEFKYYKFKPKYVKALDYFNMYDTEELINTEYEE